MKNMIRLSISWGLGRLYLVIHYGEESLGHVASVITENQDRVADVASSVIVAIMAVAAVFAGISGVIQPLLSKLKRDSADKCSCFSSDDRSLLDLICDLAEIIKST